MPLYAYKAANAKGIFYSGYRYALNKNELYASLKAENLLITSCEESNPLSPSENTKKRSITRSKDISLKLLIDFCQHMAQLDEAGVPLDIALEDLAMSSTHQKFRITLHHLHNDICSGISLSQAMAKHPNIFDSVFQILINTAECTGAFAPQFKHLESHLRRQDIMSYQLRKSLRTPFILLFLLIALVGVMVELIIPNMSALLVSLGIKELPLSTRLLLQVTKILFWLPLIAIGTGIIFAIGYFFLPASRYQISRLMLYVPFYKPLILSHFWHVFAVMTEAGIDLIPSLTQAIQIVNNIYLRNQLTTLTNTIIEGTGLSQAFEESKHKELLISPFILRLLKLSEQTGNLRKLIPKAAAQYHHQIYRQMETSIAWLEPALILLMGGVMIWVVLAVMFPFYSFLGEGNL